MAESLALWLEEMKEELAHPAVPCRAAWACDAAGVATRDAAGRARLADAAVLAKKVVEAALEQHFALYGWPVDAAEKAIPFRAAAEQAAAAFRLGVTEAPSAWRPPLHLHAEAFDAVAAGTFDVAATSLRAAAALWSAADDAELAGPAPDGPPFRMRSPRAARRDSAPQWRERLRGLQERRWRQLWGRLRGAGDPSALHADLVARYSERGRFYHTLTHIEHCLGELEWARPLAHDPDAVELALWFHDAVYDSKARDNEERSAQLAMAALQAAALPESLGWEVARLIDVTRHEAAPADIDARIVVDVDLSILGQAESIYDEYEDQVRREYAWVPGDTFAARRAEFLRALLARPTLFGTPLFQERYERPARHNIKRWLPRLDLEARGARLVVEGRHIKMALERPFGDGRLALWLYERPDLDLYAALVKLLLNGSPTRHRIRRPFLPGPVGRRDILVAEKMTLRLDEERGVYLCARDGAAEPALFRDVRPEIENLLAMAALAREKGPLVSGSHRVIRWCPDGGYVHDDCAAEDEARALADRAAAEAEAELWPARVFDADLALVYEGRRQVAILGELRRLGATGEVSVRPSEAPVTESYWLDIGGRGQGGTGFALLRELRQAESRDALWLLRPPDDTTASGDEEIDFSDPPPRAAGKEPEATFELACTCVDPRCPAAAFETRYVGVDKTDGRFADVSIWTCRTCGSLWLHYRLEKEGFRGAGRWYRGILSPEAARDLQPADAASLVARWSWHFQGGTYFGSAGLWSTTPVRLG
jgi:predicted metal-dependent HD superfamily phosphohydrolase